MLRTTAALLALTLTTYTLASKAPQGGSQIGPGETLLTMDAQGVLGGLYGSSLHRLSPIVTAPTEGAGGGVIFNEDDDAFLAQESLALPLTTFSVLTSVAVEMPERWGGIVGALEDNGDFEKGWLLGYDETSFTFAISTEATDDGNGRLIYLKADRPYVPGQLHQVAATYDGETARLFVDGEVCATNSDVGGPVVMADTARLAVGAYLDSDERYALDGRIASLWYGSDAMDEGDFAELMRKEPSGRVRGSEPWTDAEFAWSILPYLTWPTTDGVSVLAETNLPARAALRVREASSQDWIDVPAEGEDPVRIHEFVARGLRPDTKYFYEVKVTEAVGGREQSSLQSELRSFRTAPDSDERAFTFTVISDTQTQGDVAARVSNLAFEHRPNFVVHCGDLVDTGSKKTDWTETFFPSMRPLIEHAPLVPVLGNHEQDADLYYKLMSLPAPERWYSLRYGHAEFFMLDGNRSMADQSEQLKWLKKALKASDAEWRFAVLHQPPYTSDSNDYGDTVKEASTQGDMNVRNIVRTLEKHGVDLCFSGHVHDYERTFPIKDDKVTRYEDGGIVYVTAAGAGGGLEDFDATNTWFGHKKLRRHHFVHVAIHGDQLELQAMDEDGRMFDVLTLTQRGRR